MDGRGRPRRAPRRRRPGAHRRSPVADHAVDRGRRPLAGSGQRRRAAGLWCPRFWRAAAGPPVGGWRAGATEAGGRRWRLVDAGWRVRYEPAVEVTQPSRSTLRAWMAQRVSYGTSAAALTRRHPGAVAPLRISGWSALAWGSVVAGRPLVGTA